MSSFSPEDKKELLNTLNTLRQVCYPSTGLAVPSFKFKKKEEFEYLDNLEYGFGGYYIPPSEFKNLWEDKETLLDHGISYVVVNGKKWFFNTKQLVTNFFSQDGRKMVEVSFPCWLDCENIFQHPENLEAMQKVLEKCSGRSFPTQEEAIACFPKKLLRKIYDKNPSRAGIEDAVLEIKEILFKKVSENLQKNHLNDILKEPGFLSYLHKKNFSSKVSDEHKVRMYFSQNKQAMFFLAQKFGLIKNAARIMYYEPMRDHVRHPELPLFPLDPREIYRDFEKVLDIKPKGASHAKNFTIFEENYNIVQHLGDMNQILSILNQHVDPKLKKKVGKNSYYQDLIQKGFITQDEAQLIEQKRKDCKNVAHMNYARKKARQKVMDDTDLTTILFNLNNREREFQEKRRRWLKTVRDII